MMLFVLLKILGLSFLSFQLIAALTFFSDYFTTTSAKESSQNIYYYRGTGISVVRPRRVYYYYYKPKCTSVITGQNSYAGTPHSYQRPVVRNYVYRRYYTRPICCFKKYHEEASTAVPEDVTISPTYANFNPSKNNYQTTSNYGLEEGQQTKSPNFGHSKSYEISNGQNTQVIPLEITFTPSLSNSDSSQIYPQSILPPDETQETNTSPTYPVYSDADNNQDTYNPNWNPNDPNFQQQPSLTYPSDKLNFGYQNSYYRPNNQSNHQKSQQTSFTQRTNNVDSSQQYLPTSVSEGETNNHGQSIQQSGIVTSKPSITFVDSSQNYLPTSSNDIGIFNHGDSIQQFGKVTSKPPLIFETQANLNFGSLKSNNEDSSQTPLPTSFNREGTYNYGQNFQKSPNENVYMIKPGLRLTPKMTAPEKLQYFKHENTNSGSKEPTNTVTQNSNSYQSIPGNQNAGYPPGRWDAVASSQRPGNVDLNEVHGYPRAYSAPEQARSFAFDVPQNTNTGNNGF